VKSIYLLFLFCCPNLLLAQTVKGIVIDLETRNPIPGVHVQCLNSPLANVSDSSGRFIIKSPSKDKLTVRFSSVGYATAEKVIDASSEVDTVDIALVPSVILLNNSVTITAQRSEQLSLDASHSVTVIDKNDLLRKSSRNVPEGLMNEAGIWVQKTNHGGGSPIIRGLVGNQILLLVDGIRLNNATYRYGPNQYLSTIDPGLIDRIEAVRGGGSVLYGSDAIGGVVQVLSKNPLFNNDGFKVSGKTMFRWMSAGMEKSARTEIEIGDKRIAFLGGFSVRNFGDVLAGGNLGVLSPTGYKERSGDAKLLIRTGTSGILTASFQQLSQRDVPRYDQVAQGGYTFFKFEPQQRQLSYLRWQTVSSNGWLQSVRITASFNRSVEGIHSQRNNSRDFRTQRDDVGTIGFIAEVESVPKQAWHIQSGLEYYHDRVESKANVLNMDTNLETKLRGSYVDGSTVSNFSLYTSHQYDIKKTQFSVGIRFNAITVSVADNLFGDQKIYPNAWVGNAGAMIDIGKGLRTFLNANTSFRAPNIDDMSKFGVVENGVFEIPAKSLSPENARCIEAGLKIHKRRFSSTFSVYQSKVSDLIDRVTASYQGSATYENRNVYTKKNVGEARIKGIEAEVDISVVKALAVYATTTYTHGENITKREPMRRIPPLFGRVGLRYRHGSSFWMNAECAMAAQQGRLAAGDEADARIAIRLVNGVMPSWHVVNIYAGYSYKSFSVNLSGQNLFNRAYRVYASGIDGYGRSMGAAITFKF
jgi:hemoglobin/transferrin/lactoferrin receptor protein